jgi:hypothetical protein
MPTSPAFSRPAPAVNEGSLPMSKLRIAALGAFLLPSFLSCFLSSLAAHAEVIRFEVLQSVPAF